MERKVIQIVHSSVLDTPHVNGHNVTVALCNDGTMFELASDYGR